MLDLWNSRRDMFIECEWWSVDKREIIPADQICYKQTPNGTFFAKEVNSYTSDNQIVESAFMATQKTITLVTGDNLRTPVAIKQNDIVRIGDDIYRVDGIQESPVKKQNQYMNYGSSRITYLSLRG